MRGEHSFLPPSLPFFSTIRLPIALVETESANGRMSSAICAASDASRPETEKARVYFFIKSFISQKLLSASALASAKTCSRSSYLATEQAEWM